MYMLMRDEERRKKQGKQTTKQHSTPMYMYMYVYTRTSSNIRIIGHHVHVRIILYKDIINEFTHC